MSPAKVWQCSKKNDDSNAKETVSPAKAWQGSLLYSLKTKSPTKLDRNGHVRYARCYLLIEFL